MNALYSVLRHPLALGLLTTMFFLLPPVGVAQQLFDQRMTDANEVEMNVTNIGNIVPVTAAPSASLFWPRSSAMPGAYMLGGGVWFGALIQGEDVLEKRVSISYNPNSGHSWMAPGDISDGPEMQEDAASISKYRVYASTDYDADGSALDGEAPAWPLWNIDQTDVGSMSGNLGEYVSNINRRNSADQGGGPVVVSDQDLVCRYKDTDEGLYENGSDDPQPIGLQFEQAVYSWADSDHENFVLLRYDVTNVSGQDLFSCFFGHAGDYDIGDPANGEFRAGANDRFAYHKELDGRQMVVMWSDNGVDVDDQNYGYFAVALMQSPSVDADEYIVANADPTDLESQVGLATVRNWVIQNDPATTEERYDFISARIKDTHAPDGGDKRVMLASGPFNLRAGETARFVFGFFFAPGISGVPDGSLEDLAGLIAEVDKGHELWSGRVVSGVDHAEAADFGLSLSPNPARDQLNIAFTPETSGTQYTVDILDQAGRTLMTQRVRASAQQQSFTLVLDDLAAGSYFCRLSSGDGHQTAGFVVVR